MCFDLIFRGWAITKPIYHNHSSYPLTWQRKTKGNKPREILLNLIRILTEVTPTSTGILLVEDETVLFFSSLPGELGVFFFLEILYFLLSYVILGEKLISYQKKCCQKIPSSSCLFPHVSFTNKRNSVLLEFSPG